MFRQKLTGAVLAVCLFAGAGAAALSAGTSDAKITANAAQTQLNADSASLFLPESYEQYLALDSPVDIAVCEKYIAVAESDKLYIFDRTEENGVYHTYSHEKAQISKIQFSDDENLYFSDTALGFYQLNLSDLDNMTTMNSSLPSLSTFYIEHDTLFEVTVVTTGTSYYSAPLSNPSEKTSFASNENKNTPQLGFSNGNFYSVVGPLVTLYSLNGTESKYTATESFDLQAGLSGLKSVTVVGNDLFYTVNGSSSSSIADGLYHCDLTSKTPSLLFSGDGYGALTSYDGKLYAVKGNAVMEYSLGSGVEKTDYEISSSSDSVNRLSGATDSARAGNLLVTADKGNSRLSVYDMEKKSYSVISLSYSPSYVATDGEIIAAASENTVYLYGRNREGNFEQTFFKVETTISGLVCLYGNCYFVTHSFGYGKIERADGEFHVISCTRDALSQKAPTALAGDLYGNLYVVRSDGSVVRFTEEIFANNNTAQGENLDYNLPTGFKCVRADFEGNLYCLNSAGVLCKNGEPFASIDGKNFVYTAENSVSPVSYALGFEDDCVYFNFGNFIVKTNAGALGFPSYGRLSDAQDIARAGDLLVTADTGNSRITVYDMKKRSFAVIQTDFSPTLVATDGSVIAAADGNKVYVCKDPNKNQTFGEPTIADLGTIKGLACVHGSVYYITEYGYGKVEEEDFGLVSRLEGSLAALTADVNGILYVVDTSGHVRYFYEDEFIDPAVVSGGDAGLTLHMPISSLRADHEGNLYYLSENALWKNDKKLAELGNNSFAYGGENSPVAFALDYENDEVYLLYGNYIVKTKSGALGILFQNHTDSFASRLDIPPPDSRRKRS